VRHLEFWPDYGDALLHEDGGAVAIDGLGLPDDLVDRARRWVSRYDDARLEPATRDASWIAEGRTLFGELRILLRPSGIEVYDWEGYWDASSDDPPGSS
jgi:hypothetical protein